MRRIRSKGTLPELRVRKIIRALKIPYRSNSQLLPGTPDIVFHKDRKVAFVHGCFFHRHSKCVDGKRLPKSRLEYWEPKLNRNVMRDRSNRLDLLKRGWKTVIIWECELSKPDKVAARIERFIRG